MIDTQRCTGCGACLEVCPRGAIYLVDDVAVVDGLLCRACELCVAACPSEAISQITDLEKPVTEPNRAVIPISQPEVVRIRTKPVAVPLRSRVLPVMGSVLAWAGQEILPRMADYVLYTLERRTVSKDTPAVTRRGSDSASRGAGKGGGRRRHRHRHGQ